MTFARSILVLVTVVAAICFPIFFGYGLSEQSFMWMGLGFGFLAFAAALAHLQTRADRRRDNSHTRAYHQHS
jgi:hypothetical protein